MAATKTKKDTTNGVEIIVPIDASEIEDRSGLNELKAVLVDGGDEVHATTAKLKEDGTAEARFKLPRPTAARVILGPPDASDKEMQGLQTLAVDVPLRAWADEPQLKLEPLLIRPWYWYWWLQWCRTFTIRGRLLCPDGSPVPGATICAFDVDRFWWWCTKEQVGCATTDATGAFSMTFRWCCGWWPWWWWRRRHWQIDSSLLERIRETLEPLPDPPPLPRPDPVPDLGVFRKLLSGDRPAPRPQEALSDPADLDALRPELLKRLPVAPDLQALRLWPWAPWHPWSDCTPDIIFQATQDCGQGEVTVLDENCGDARWNIPTTLNVTLVSTDDACCAQPRPRCPEGECVVLTHLCNDLVSTVGGNTGAPPAPAGYRDPGAISTAGDRPYAGVVPVRGVCADWIDYYSFEYSADGGASWNPLPSNSTGGFTLSYYDPGGPPWFVPVTFNFSTVDGQWVAETLGHWESVNGPRIWVGDITRLINWRTTQAASPTGPTALFPDGTYRLRLRGWRETPGGLVNLGVPPRCGTQTDEDVVVTLDNRLVGPSAGHPTAPDHPVGGVHLATTEPDTDFTEVRINGAAASACAIIDARGTLEIDFLVHDPDAHLAYYTLHALWGENNKRDLLDPALVPSGTLTRISAAQVGPTYSHARSGAGGENVPAAVAPKWEGGRMCLTVTNIREAFPEPCCYLLDLRAYKRTIVNCNGDFDDGHTNRSTLTFTVT